MSFELAHLLSGWQTGITDSQRKQFDQKVLDMAHAVADIEQALLQHAQGGHIHIQI